MDNPRVITEEDVWEVADTLYWQILNVLGIEDECVELDPDSDGTRNTEKGEALYYCIEDTLQAWREQTDVQH